MTTFVSLFRHPTKVLGWRSFMLETTGATNRLRARTWSLRRSATRSSSPTSPCSGRTLHWWISTGQLVHGVDPIPEVSHTLGSEQITLEREQQQVVEAIGQRVALALYWAKASTGDWDEPEEPSFTVDWSWDSAFAVLGPAGSGKSTTIMVAVEKAQAAGARVVLACPTRMLVAAYRQKYPDLDVDSVHAVFQLFRPISAAVFERLLRIWEAAGNQPALVFISDFAQLKGVEPTQARDSPFWSTVFKFERCGAAGAPLCVGSWSSSVLPSLRRSSSPTFSVGIAHLGAKIAKGTRHPHLRLPMMTFGPSSWRTRTQSLSPSPRRRLLQ